MIGTSFRDLAIRHHQNQTEDSDYTLAPDRFVAQSVREDNSGVRIVRDLQQLDGHECLQHRIRTLRAMQKHARDELADIERLSSKRIRPSTTADGVSFPGGNFMEGRFVPARASFPLKTRGDDSTSRSLDASLIDKQLLSYPSLQDATRIQHHHAFQRNLLPVRAPARGSIVQDASAAQLYSTLEDQAAEIARLRRQLNASDQRLTKLIIARNHPSAHNEPSPLDQRHFDSNIELDHLLHHHRPAAAAATATQPRMLRDALSHSLGKAQQQRGVNDMPSYQVFLPGNETLLLAREQHAHDAFDTYQRQQLAALGSLPSSLVINRATFDPHHRTRMPSNVTEHLLAMASEPPRGPAVQQQAHSPNMVAGSNTVVSADGSCRPCNTTIVTLPCSISMALAADRDKLSEYQCMVRQHLEFFVAQEEDASSNIQGRKKRIHVGQVGMRCRDCAQLPLHSRGRGSVYYPSKLDGIYQAAQNMATTHLSESCSMISAEARLKLIALRERKETASRKGKGYWGEACQQLGIYESNLGLSLAVPWP